MRITKGFRGKLLPFEKKSKPSSGHPMNDGDELLRAVKNLAASEARRQSEKQAAGRCMSPEEYERIEQSLLSLAERMNLEMTSDIQGKTGFITLAAPSFRFNRDEQPDLADAFASALSAAHRAFFSAIPESGQTLIQLTLLFDLAG